MACSIEQRQDIVRLMADARASQRAIAATLGVGQATVSRALKMDIDSNESKPKKGHKQNQGVTDSSDSNESKPEKPHVSHATGNNEWYTPPNYIEAARKARNAKNN
jgi:hypothetical protein